MLLERPCCLPFFLLRDEVGKPRYCWREIFGGGLVCIEHFFCQISVVIFFSWGFFGVFRVLYCYKAFFGRFGRFVLQRQESPWRYYLVLFINPVFLVVDREEPVGCNVCSAAAVTVIVPKRLLDAVELINTLGSSHAS